MESDNIKVLNDHKTKKYIGTTTRTTFVLLLVLLALVVALMMLNVCVGSVHIPVAELLGKLSPIHRDIVFSIRLPRALAAMILGGALALSGYLMQSFFHNPIAGPFVLGISSGAKLVVALTMVFSLSLGVKIHSLSLIVAAFLGAMLSMGFVLLVARVVEHNGMLIVAGIMIGYIGSAITDLVVTFADDSNIVNLHNWSLGSFSGIAFRDVFVMSIVVAVVFAVTFCMAKPIGAYLLGEVYAKNLGVNVKALRLFLVIASSLLAACVTAFAGPISFVGIAVPHLVKSLFKTTRPILMIPASFLGGSIFVLFSDFVSRMMFAPMELSISTVTAIFGAPVVICILIRKQKEAV